MDEEISGRQLAEVLKYLANRVQDGLDSGQEVLTQLKVIAEKLEDKRA